MSEVWLCPEALAMWTVEQRARYRRDDLRYPSDLSDAEWEVIEPLLPPARPGGRPRTVDLRAVVEGMLYVLETGCQWRHLPKDFPPRSTVHAYLQQWATDGTLEQIHHALYVRVREQEGREASPTGAIVDAQSVKSAEKGGRIATRLATMPARRSRGSSARFWSTRSVYC